MDLKQGLRESVARLKRRACSVLQHLFSSSLPSLIRSGPQPLRGPWDEGWTLDLHSYRTTAGCQLTELGHLTRKYKYRGRIDLADRLTDRIIGLMEQHPSLKTIDGIVTVPSSVQRLYDPVCLLGQVLAQRLGITLLKGILQKTRRTEPQKEMRTRAQKRANVAGAFAVRGDVRGKSLLVLDDLYDSGETLKEVTRVLQRAGARSVKVLTLTRTRHTHPR
ncbi:MAG: phosphoribosyltransferase family protein [Candidatus Bipolaricaulota bacterium]|nr:phosphoribosyltransferase family protein [Candidatus Bipolaricaulota bacterium]MCS7273979.1 phosphoribosyltransferase family protein [Candidatus Bipolaricaulota bacterium]MDW8111332.1 phosphoribosyltransferase family protein [Candidatus Bipolaricaulota bacterium]MDW8329248.1 phosphoribosyltransferase family protein [Candidatus Bipolaricaulota bacterium]